MRLSSDFIDEILDLHNQMLEADQAQLPKMKERLFELFRLQDSFLFPIEHSESPLAYLNSANQYYAGILLSRRNRLTQIIATNKNQGSFGSTGRHECENLDYFDLHMEYIQELDEEMLNAVDSDLPEMKKRLIALFVHLYDGFKQFGRPKKYAYMSDDAAVEAEYFYQDILNKRLEMKKEAEGAATLGDDFNQCIEDFGIIFNKLNRPLLDPPEAQAQSVVRSDLKRFSRPSRLDQFKTSLIAEVLGRLGFCFDEIVAYEDAPSGLPLPTYRLISLPSLNDRIGKKAILFSEKKETSVFIIRSTNGLDDFFPLSLRQLSQHDDVFRLEFGLDTSLFKENLYRYLLCQSELIDLPVLHESQEIPLILPCSALDEGGAVDVRYEYDVGLNKPAEEVVRLQRVDWHDVINGFLPASVKKNIDQFNVPTFGDVAAFGKKGSLLPLYSKELIDLLTLRVNKNGEVDIQGRRAVALDRYAVASGISAGYLWKLVNREGLVSVYSEHHENPLYCRIYDYQSNNNLLTNVYWGDQVDVIIDQFKERNRYELDKDGVTVYEGQDYIAIARYKKVAGLSADTFRKLIEMAEIEPAKLILKIGRREVLLYPKEKVDRLVQLYQSKIIYFYRGRLHNLDAFKSMDDDI